MSSGRAASIDVNPNFAPPYNQLGYALRTVGDFAGAEKAFQKYTKAREKVGHRPARHRHPVGHPA